MQLKVGQRVQGQALMGNKNALGKIRTEETKQKMSLAAKRRWQND